MSGVTKKHLKITRSKPVWECCADFHHLHTVIAGFPRPLLPPNLVTVMGKNNVSVQFIVINFQWMWASFHWILYDDFMLNTCLFHFLFENIYFFKNPLVAFEVIFVLCDANISFWVCHFNLWYISLRLHWSWREI